MNQALNTSKIALLLQTFGLAFLPLIFGPGVGAIPLSWILSFGLLTLGSLLDHLPNRRTGKHIVLLILIVSLSSVLAVTNGISLSAATPNTTDWLTLTLVFAAVVLLMQSRISKPLPVLRNGLILSGAIISIVRIFDLLASGTLDLSGAQQPVLTEYYLQSAYIVALASVASFHLALSTENLRIRFLAWAIFLILTSVVLSFASRTATLMAFIGVVLIATAKLKTSRRKISYALLAVPILAVALSALYLSPAGSQLRQRFTDPESLELNSLRRSQIQDLSLHVASKNPMGIGWDSFSTYSSTFLGESIRSTHSLYTGLILSIGIVGAVTLIGFLLFVLFSGLLSSNPAAALPSALSAAVLAAGIGDDITVYPIGLTFLLFLVCLSLRILWSTKRA